eukprot:TRINITY_DN3583_c0_g1_i1.p1 TRINITY_DN3583_c0_g1~~TRINITY_DN3583_c0_g1_i1.p1  ORF type:complete len:101 (-),score=25.73 TRINITY_DN3583_c0_g1_i1:382-684(-)
MRVLPDECLSPLPALQGRLLALLAHCCWLDVLAYAAGLLRVMLLVLAAGCVAGLLSLHMAATGRLPPALWIDVLESVALVETQASREVISGRGIRPTDHL